MSRPGRADGNSTGRRKWYSSLGQRDTDPAENPAKPGPGESYLGTEGRMSVAPSSGAS